MPPTESIPRRRSRRPLAGALFVAALACAGIAAAQAPPGVESEDLDAADPADPAKTASSPETAPDPMQPASAPEVGGEEEAARAYAEGDLPRALTIYRDLAARQGDPATRTRLRTTAAWLLFESGDRSGAAESLVQAFGDTPDLRPAGSLYSAEFLALAEDARAEAARRREAAAARLLSEGLAAAGAGDRATARARFDATLALNAVQPRAVQALALVDLAEDRDDEALAGFQKVLAWRRSTPALVPRDLESQAFNNVGVIYYSRSQYQDAAEALERATALAPGDARAWFNLALARTALGRKVDGMRALERARELDRGDASIALHLGRAYRDAGSHVEAVALLLDATKAHPDDAALLYELALAQRGLGNRAGMYASLARAAAADASNRAGLAAPAAVTEAEERLADRDFPAASAAATRATTLDAGSASAWALLGLARRGEGRLDEAADALIRSAALAPERSDVAHNLGTVELARKRLPEAEAAFRRAIELDPSSAESSAALARIESARAAEERAAEGRGRGGRAARNGATPAPAAPRDAGVALRAVDYQPLGIQGLLVERLVAGGAAERAGLLVDDLVLRADGRPLTQVPTFTALVRAARGSLALSVLRAGRPVELVLRFD